MSRLQERFQYPRQLILEACGGSKAAAEILNYLLSCFHLRHRKHQNAPIDAEVFTFQYSASHLANKTFYRCRNTIVRALKVLRSRELIFVHQSETSLNRSLSYRINFARLELWRENNAGPLFSQMLPCTVTECHSAELHPVTMHSTRKLPCTATECVSVYKHLNTTSNTHSSSMESAAAVPLDSSESEVVQRLVVEGGFVQELAAALVSEHGGELVKLGLGELAKRKSRPSSTVAFLRAFLKRPQDCNATRSPSGWQIPATPDLINHKMVLAASKSLAYARSIGLPPERWLHEGMEIPIEYKKKALEMEMSA